MKILLISDLYPLSNKEILTPKVLYDFVKDWKILGHEVEILRPNFLLNTFVRGKKICKTGQYENAYNANYFTPFWFNVKSKIPKYDYDVIIAHMPSGVIFSNKFNGKKVCAVHNSDIEVLTNPIYKFYFKPEMEKAYKNASAIACRSEVLKNKFLKLYPQFENKIFLAPSGISFEPILKKKNEKRNIITCANLIKRKNIKILIEAVNEFENLNLTVIGDGKELKNLQKISKNNIKFLGRLEHSKVLENMKNSDIFILPSINETFGMVYLEAMAAGCITVGIKNDGIDGIIKNGENGFLTLPNKDAIEKTLLEILEMDDIQIKILLQNCYNTVNSYKSLDCAERYIENVLKFI